MKPAIKPATWKRISFLVLLPAVTLLALTCTKTVYEDAMTGPREIKIPTRATRLPDGSFRQAYSTEESDIYFVVEEMPDFQGGGQTAFRDYIANNIRYPENAVKDSIEGRVFVQFTVKADGSVEDARIVRGIDPSLDQEALRVTLASPEWTPGLQDGKPVAVVFTFPINFTLQ